MVPCQVGDSLAFKGPIPKYPYKPNALSHIGMVAGACTACVHMPVTP
jgi:hypothetical protein